MQEWERQTDPWPRSPAHGCGETSTSSDRRSAALNHIFGDSGLSDLEAELQKLAVNARRTPQGGVSRATDLNGETRMARMNQRSPITRPAYAIRSSPQRDEVFGTDQRALGPPCRHFLSACGLYQSNGELAARNRQFEGPSDHLLRIGRVNAFTVSDPAHLHGLGAPPGASLKRRDSIPYIDCQERMPTSYWMRQAPELLGQRTA